MKSRHNETINQVNANIEVNKEYSNNVVKEIERDGAQRNI